MSRACTICRRQLHGGAAIGKYDGKRFAVISIGILFQVSVRIVGAGIAQCQQPSAGHPDRNAVAFHGLCDARRVGVAQADEREMSCPDGRLLRLAPQLGGRCCRIQDISAQLPSRRIVGDRRQGAAFIRDAELGLASSTRAARA